MSDHAFTRRRVLVTGASGFLGRHLSRRLIRDGASVQAVSRRPRDSAGDSLCWWRADLTDQAQVEQLLRAARPELVFHLSGLVTAAPELEHVLPTFQSLVVSTVHLLSASQRTGNPRVVLAGSLAEPHGARPIPGSPYGAAKWAASTYGQLFRALYGAPVTITQLGYTYGPDQDPRRLIPQVVAALLRGEAPRLTSGRLCADWVYIDDMIDGLMAVATSERAVGTTLDLGSGRLVSVRDLVSQLIEISGASVEPQFGALPDRPAEQFRAADTARTLELAGWRAQTSLEDGLRMTLQWYRGGHGTC